LALVLDQVTEELEFHQGQMNDLIAAAEFEVGKIYRLSVYFERVADAILGRFASGPFAAA
jgi:hypothetical protein